MCVLVGSVCLTQSAASAVDSIRLIVASRWTSTSWARARCVHVSVFGTGIMQSLTGNGDAGVVGDVAAMRQNCCKLLIGPVDWLIVVVDSVDGVAVVAVVVRNGR